MYSYDSEAELIEDKLNTTYYQNVKFHNIDTYQVINVYNIHTANISMVTIYRVY